MSIEELVKVELKNSDCSTQKNTTYATVHIEGFSKRLAEAINKAFPCRQDHHTFKWNNWQQKYQCDCGQTKQEVGK